MGRGTEDCSKDKVGHPSAPSRSTPSTTTRTKDLNSTARIQPETRPSRPRPGREQDNLGAQSAASCHTNGSLPSTPPNPPQTPSTRGLVPLLVSRPCDSHKNAPFRPPATGSRTGQGPSCALCNHYHACWGQASEGAPPLSECWGNSKAALFLADTRLAANFGSWLPCRL